VARFVTVSFGIGAERPGRKDECALLQKAEADVGQPRIPDTDREAG
jgi:hypothetical protein